MTTKWKSELFSNEKMKNKINKNIDIHQIEEKIKNIKNINHIEPFETIDMNENLKEGFGIFKKDEFTGYDYDDPEHKGNLSDITGSLSDIIDDIYDSFVYAITLTARYTVKAAGGGDDGDDEGDDEGDDNNPEEYIPPDYNYIPPSESSFDNWFNQPSEGFQNENDVPLPMPVPIDAEPVNNNSSGGINLFQEENNFLGGYSEQGEDKRSPEQKEEDIEHNVDIVRKYVALFFCLSIAYFATFNWYFITTLQDTDGSVNKYVNMLRQNLYDEDTGTYEGIASFFYKKQGTTKEPNMFFVILYFFFGISFKILDHVNMVLVKFLPQTITNIFGKLVTFLFLYVLLVYIFYYFAEVMKDWLKSLLTGQGFGILTSVMTIYILGVCCTVFFSDKPWKENYVSDFSQAINTAATGGIAGAVYMGTVLVVNILRYILMAGVTIGTLPVLLGVVIIFYSFFSILMLGDKGITRTFKDIFSDCTENFKATSYAEQETGNSLSMIKWWFIFILMLMSDFSFHALLNIAYIFVFGLAIIDYLTNIKGDQTRNTLIQITSIVLGFAGFFLFGIFRSVAANKMLEAGLNSIKTKHFEKYNPENIEEQTKFDIPKKLSVNLVADDGPQGLSSFEMLDRMK